MRHPPPTSHPAHSAKAPAHLLDPHAQRWKHSYHCVNVHGEWGRSWVDVWAPCSCFALLNSCCNLKLSTTPAAGVVCVCPCPSVPPPRVLSVVCSTTFAFDFVPRLPLLSPTPPPPPPPLPPLLGHLRMDKSSGTSSGPASAGAPVARRVCCQRGPHIHTVQASGRVHASEGQQGGNPVRHVHVAVWGGGGVVPRNNHSVDRRLPPGVEIKEHSWGKRYIRAHVYFPPGYSPSH